MSLCISKKSQARWKRHQYEDGKCKRCSRPQSIIKLDKTDSKIFIDALLNPSEPNEALKNLQKIVLEGN